jgi:hypothetical protein
MSQSIFFVLFIISRHVLHRKHGSSIVACIPLNGNAYTRTQFFHSNDSTRHNLYCDTTFICACGYYLATAVSMAPQFLLWANTPQYIKRNQIKLLLSLLLLLLLWNYLHKQWINNRRISAGDLGILLAPFSITRSKLTAIISFSGFRRPT